MRLILTTVLFFGIMVGQGNALTLRATSGEHADFSRVIIFVDEPIEWQIGRIEGGYAFDYSGTASSFDWSDVFKYIPKGRLLEIRHNTEIGRIEFQIECVCHIDAFELRNGHVAVDFKDGAPASNSRFEDRIDTSDASVEDELEEQPPTSAPSKSFLTSAVSPDLDHFRNSLMRSFANSASSGDVSINQTRSSLDIVSASEGKTEVANIPLDADILAYNQQLTVRRSGVDQADHRRTIAACIQGNELKFDSQETASLDLIQKYRSEVISPSFTASPESIFYLAKAYLALGLASEARIAAMESEEEIAKQLVQLTSVLLGEASSENRFPSGQLECRTQLSVWAAVKEGSVKNSSDESLASIVDNFSQMPRYLQIELGPRLEQVFLDSNQSVLAEKISRITSGHIGNALSPKSALTDEYLSALGDSVLQLARRENNEIGALATLETVSRLIQRKQKPSNDLIVEVAALATQYSGSDLEARLIGAQADLLSLGGNHLEAFDLQESLSILDSRESKDRLNRLFTNLVENATDYELGLISVEFENLYEEGLLSAELEVRIVARLLVIGIPEIPLNIMHKFGISDVVAETVHKSMRALEGYENTGAFSSSAADQGHVTPTSSQLSGFLERLENFSNVRAEARLLGVIENGALDPNYDAVTDIVAKLAGSPQLVQVFSEPPSLNEITELAKDARSHRVNVESLLNAIPKVN